MTTIKIENIEYRIPAAWNELTAGQLSFLIRNCTEPAIGMQEIKVKMLLYCLKAHVRMKKGNIRFVCPKQQIGLSADDLIPLCEVFDFLFSDPDATGVRNLIPRITRNPVPAIQVGRHTLTGPADGLTDLSYDRFIYSQTWFSRINDSPEIIDRLVAVLYTENGKSNISLTCRIPMAQKILILWYYTGCLYFLSAKYPRVFSPSNGVAGNVYENQMRILHTLANGDLTKKEVVRQSMLYDALYTMEFSAEQYEDEKNKYSS